MISRRAEERIAQLCAGSGEKMEELRVRLLEETVSAIRFVLDHAELNDEGPVDEGWQSDEMTKAVETLRSLVGYPAGYSGNPDGY